MAPEADHRPRLRRLVAHLLQREGDGDLQARDLPKLLRTSEAANGDSKEAATFFLQGLAEYGLLPRPYTSIPRSLLRQFADMLEQSPSSTAGPPTAPLESQSSGSWTPALTLVLDPVELLLEVVDEATAAALESPLILTVESTRGPQRIILRRHVRSFLQALRSLRCAVVLYGPGDDFGAFAAVLEGQDVGQLVVCQQSTSRKAIVDIPAPLRVNAVCVGTTAEEGSKWDTAVDLAVLNVAAFEPIVSLPCGITTFDSVAILEDRALEEVLDLLRRLLPHMAEKRRTPLQALRDFASKVFKDCVVCVPDGPGAMMLRRLIRTHGGKAGDVTTDHSQTTHLVCDAEYAREFGSDPDFQDCLLVDDRWVTESVRRLVRQP